MGEKEWDVLVVGAGLLGMSTAAALSDIGKAVLVLEAQCELHHTFGSSHGRSRITRTLAGETPVFAKMARASKERMRAMGALRGDMNALFIVRKGSASYDNVKAELEGAPGSSSREFTFEEIDDEFGVRMRPGEVCFIDNTGGAFDPFIVLDYLEKQICGTRGNDVRFKSRVLAWSVNSTGIQVATESGEARCKKLVIATGGWTPTVAAAGKFDEEARRALMNSMKLERIPLFFFDYPKQLKKPAIPITFLDSGRPDMYAMPDKGEPERLKVGFHHGIEYLHPDVVCRDVEGREKQRAMEYMKPLVGGDLRLDHADVCLYASAKDRDVPLVGPLPKTDNVYLAAYGAGDSAKHALALGAALARMMFGENPGYDKAEMDAFDPGKRLKLQN